MLEKYVRRIGMQEHVAEELVKVEPVAPDPIKHAVVIDKIAYRRSLHAKNTTTLAMMRFSVIGGVAKYPRPNVFPIICQYVSLAARTGTALILSFSILFLFCRCAHRPQQLLQRLTHPAYCSQCKYDRNSSVPISERICLPKGEKLRSSHFSSDASNASVCSCPIRPRITAPRRCAISLQDAGGEPQPAGPTAHRRHGSHRNSRRSISTPSISAGVPFISTVESSTIRRSNPTAWRSSMASRSSSISSCGQHQPLGEEQLLTGRSTVVQHTQHLLVTYPFAGPPQIDHNETPTEQGQCQCIRQRQHTLEMRLMHARHTFAVFRRSRHNRTRFHSRQVVLPHRHVFKVHVRDINSRTPRPQYRSVLPKAHIVPLSNARCTAPRLNEIRQVGLHPPSGTRRLVGLLVERVVGISVRGARFGYGTPVPDPHNRYLD